MNYIEVFQLAEQKGYEFTTSWYEDSDEVDLLQLTLIQKWIRDIHNIHIDIIFLVPNRYTYAFINLLNSASIKEVDYKINYITYEETLLNGINEALKLIK